MACNTYRLFGVAPAAAVGARITGLVPRSSAGECGTLCGLVRVAGNIVANVRSGGPLVPEIPPSSSQVSACPFVKLSISTSDGLGRVLIDADSQLVLPGRDVCGVQVLAPTTFDEPGPQSTATGIVWDVHGAIQIRCVTDGAAVLGRLTEFQTLEAAQQVTFIRPRCARHRVQFFSQGVPQFWELWAGAPGVGQLVGILTVPAASLDIVELMPGITHIRNLPFASATTQIGIVWEIGAL